MELVFYSIRMILTEQRTCHVRYLSLLKHLSPTIVPIKSNRNRLQLTVSLKVELKST
jgi:hypothetical protein